ncbi:hypothetical protein EYB33_00725 (plasmid) [Lysinibacillus sphaericus]|uniref:hypothetical protein n=1 Tax=Lysinibacillus TaxID=400634 RepID=UPI00142DAD56|nr:MULTISPECIES: hypothetical protein [Lysinibacillus]UDK94805.1 hypothetical protein EYB33_00120 [Lysinibacillus sphaericus]UDK94898.1 hypothetical protein EYB33_00725 [Lysinibacillus sphaericus]
MTQHERNKIEEFKIAFQSLDEETKEYALTLLKALQFGQTRHNFLIDKIFRK